MRILGQIRIDRAAILATIVVALDQLTKWWAFEAIEEGESVNVFLGITFTQTRNEGIAFGFFAGRPALVAGILMWTLGRSTVAHSSLA